MHHPENNPGGEGFRSTSDPNSTTISQFSVLWLIYFTAQFFRASFLKYIAFLISDEGGGRSSTFAQSPLPAGNPSRVFIES